MHRYLILRVLLFSLIPNLVSAEQLPVACIWLERMNEAMVTLNYEGHFVYQHGNSLEAMRMRHVVSENGPEEHLQSLNGVVREVIRSKDRITVIENNAGKVSVRQRNASGTFSTLPALELDALQDYYNMVIGESARVAGRPGQVIALEPRDQYRYGYRLTLDKGTALPLELAVLDTNGDPVSRIMYTNISISLPEPAMPEDPSSEEEIVFPVVSGVGNVKAEPAPQEKDVDITKVTQWKFASLPTGFTLRNYQQKTLGKNGQKLEHFVFSDGLASISVYIEPYVASHALSGSASLAAVNAVGRKQGEYQLTVVGEVPAAALLLVVSGVELN